MSKEEIDVWEHVERTWDAWERLEGDRKLWPKIWPGIKKNFKKVSAGEAWRMSEALIGEAWAGLIK